MFTVPDDERAIWMYKSSVDHVDQYIHRLISAHRLVPSEPTHDNEQAKYLIFAHFKAEYATNN